MVRVSLDEFLLSYCCYDALKNFKIEDEFLKPEYSHIIEIYDFPVSFKNENIMNAFQTEV